jgi:signal transduction histidine kinase
MPSPHPPLRHAANTEQVYISFTVQDTGRGLSDVEKELLFARFSQASPRTHINYGDFISFLLLKINTSLNANRRFRAWSLHL